VDRVSKRATQEKRARNRERSENWVITPDEFHPNAKTAARHADAKARTSQVRYLEGELDYLKRVGPRAPGELAARKHADNLAHLTRELVRLCNEMVLAKEREEKHTPTAVELGGEEDKHLAKAKKRRLAALASQISRAKKAGEDEKLARLQAEREELKA
jgi:hypothetical protein